MEADEEAILAIAAENPIASPEEIAADFNVDADEVERIIDQRELPDSSTVETADENDDDEPPRADTDKVRVILRDNDSLRQRAINSKQGYRDEVYDAIEERWGEGYRPGPQTISNIAREFREATMDGAGEESEQPSEPVECPDPDCSDMFANSQAANIHRTMAHGKDEEETDTDETADEDPALADSSTEQKSLFSLDESEKEKGEAADVDEESDDETEVPDGLPEDPPSQGRERAKVYLEFDSGLREQLVDGETDPETVASAIGDVWGVAYKPSPGAVEQAVVDLREAGIIESDDGEDITGAGPNTRILYQCTLCDKEDTNKSAIRKHITATDDAVHADRNGNEGHLIESTGEPIEDPDVEEGEVEDGFELLWAIHNNPEARQEDIANILDVSQPTVVSRCDDFGIDWENRQEDVADHLEDLGFKTGTDDGRNDIETLERTVGNASYSGPETGLDMSDVSYLSDVAPQTQNEPSTDDRTVTIELTPDEAYRVLIGEPSAMPGLRESLFAALPKNFSPTG